jgi:hypothetical protein
MTTAALEREIRLSTAASLRVVDGALEVKIEDALPGRWLQYLDAAQTAELRDALNTLAAPVALTRLAWTADMGNVFWWAFPVEQAPYVGTPLDEAFPEHCTHWTPLIIPRRPGR